MKNRKSKKYQSVITKRIFRSVKKLSAVLVLALCATSVLTIGGTNAGFSDIEESTGNTFAATSLDARVSYIERFSVSGMTPDNTPDENMTFKNVGGLDFQYSVQFTKTAGDDALCDALILTAKRGSTVVYDHLLLKNFGPATYSGSPFVIPVAGQDSWNFAIELASDAGSALENKNCTWNFDFTAWQTNVPAPTGGFVDMETAGTHSISTGEWLTPGDVVINEVMWMGSAGDDDDEWIELKNMTGYDIDLSNWDIENGGTGAGHIEIPAGYTIKANGYFLILNNKWDETAVSLTADLSHSQGYTHVSGMNLLNGGEQLTLEDEDNNVIDRTPIGAWAAGLNGASKQSMERNDIPGDGTLAGSWHTCVSGNCNDGIYWDAAGGSNFGTPLAANLSPIVMNEFVLNPVGDDGADRPDGEWIELYNIVDEDIDVLGWYFTNLDGDVIAVTEDNTASGTTVVPAKGTLVVYLEEAFLDNTADTLSLYAPGVLPEDASDDVREDTFTYEDADLLPEGKSYARFPDGEGIWIDPEATPGEENVMAEEDVQIFRRLTYDLCFANERLKKDATEEMCSPIFLTYIGMLKAVDETKIPDSVLLDILGAIRLEEEEKLLALLDEDGVLSPEELALVPVVEIVTEEDMTEPIIEDEESEEPAENDTTDESDTESVPVPVVIPVVEAPVIVEEIPAEEPVNPESVEAAPVTPEAPAVVPEEKLVVEEPAVVEEPVAKVEETPVEETIPVN